LSDSAIGSRTGLSVIALERNGELIAPLASETVLTEDAELVMLGSHDQRNAFGETFGKA
jgi:K+/H+ antiporter YhaU regulatory subunit KhtT